VTATLAGDGADQSAPTGAAGRAACAFAALALGMVVARQVHSIAPIVWWSVGAGACAAAVLLRGRGAAGALLVAAVALGGATFATRITARTPDALTRIVTAGANDEPLIITVEGLALDTPRPPLLDSPMAAFGAAAPLGSFSLRAERVLTESGWAACDSTLWCRVRATAYSSRDGLGGFGVRAGQRVRLTGTAEPVRTLENPGQTDARVYAAQAGVAGSLRADSPELVRVTEESPRGIRARLAAWRDALHARALRALDFSPGSPTAARALVLSLFLGADEPGERDLRAAFTRLGLAHVLAISGVHVIVMAGVGLFLLRLTGERGALEPLGVALMVAIYLMVVPASAPVVRAGVMTLALLAGEAIGRRYDRLAIIAWCACGIILWRPLDLWSLGFQLSFGLTALLLWLGRRAHENIFGPTIRGLAPVRRTNSALALRWLWGKSKLAFSASLLCWSAALPLIAFRTGLISPLAVLTSLVTLPAFTILMWVGYLALFVGLAWPGGAEILHPPLRVAAGACVALVRSLDQLPLMSVRVPPFSIALAGGASIFAVLWVSRARLRDRRYLAAAAILAVFFALDWTVRSRQRDDRLRLDAVAVGEGSCVLLRSGSDRMLWNAGSERTGAGQRMIPGALREQGAWRVPTVVVTSPELNHVNAIPDLVEPLGVRSVLLCGPAAREARERPESGAAWLASHLRERGVTVRDLAPGERITLGECSIELVESSRAEGANPGHAPPWLGIIRDSRGEPLAMLAGDLNSRELASVLATPAAQGVGIITTGPDIRTIAAPGAIVLSRRADDPALDSLTLGVTGRSAWASVGSDGACGAGRHQR